MFPAVAASSLRRRLRWPRIVAITLAVGAGCTKPASAPPPAPPAEPAAEAPKEPALNPERMLSLLETLASDEFGGRYTLSKDIEASAALVGKVYAEAGVSPVGGSYTAPFSLVTGVTTTGPSQVSVSASPSARPTAAKEGSVVPLRASGSGTATAEAVFVGYAAEGTDADGKVVYDDLAGVDVKGKIAVVLKDAPSEPSVRAFFGEIRDLVDAFEADTAALREAGKVKALAAKHIALRKRVAKMAEPYLRGKPLPASFTAAPEDPLSPPTTRELTSPILFHTKDLPGPQFSRRQSRLGHKLQRLADAGAAGVIVVKGPRSFVTKAAKKRDALPELDSGGRPVRTAFELPIVQMQWKEADRLFRGGNRISAKQKAVDTSLTPKSGVVAAEVTITTKIERQTADIPNVLGYIPGTETPEEIVMLGAHYDHIGRDTGGPGHCRARGEGDDADDICNGADDNGSGTAIVVELARALGEAGYQPKRTLVFALFAGEELGLLGSEAMAENLPTAAPFDNGKIVAMLNIDMVGRLRPELGLAIGGIGSSSGWMPLLDKLDSRQMPIMFDRSITTRSDHASFFRHDIPVLFFFTHVHDDYHAPGDEMSGINREGMASIAAYVLDATRAAAEGHVLPFTKGDGLVGALPGDDPSTLVKKIGFAEGGKAAAAPPAP